jgi:hypothetical protein
MSAAPYQPTKANQMPITVKQQVTFSLLKWIEGQSRIVKFTAPIFKGKEVKNTRGGDGVSMEPADLARVHTLNDAEEVILDPRSGKPMVYEIIIGAVLGSQLHEHFENDGYVGKWFAITQLPKADKKKYRPYEIVEVGVDEKYIAPVDPETGEVKEAVQSTVRDSGKAGGDTGQ